MVRLTQAQASETRAGLARTLSLPVLGTHLGGCLLALCIQSLAVSFHAVIWPLKLLNLVYLFIYFLSKIIYWENSKSLLKDTKNYVHGEIYNASF